MRTAALVFLAALAACASGPRGSDLPPTELPPPRLSSEDCAQVARAAGASLAAATTAAAAVGRGPIGFARVANVIPWRELRELDERVLRFAFEKACGVETVAGASSFSLLVDVVAFAHRIRDGAASVEYSLGFLLVDADGGTPWAACVTRTVEGGKGDVATQALSFRDLDALAADAAAHVAQGLRSVGAVRVHVTPCRRERRPDAVVAVAFEDRLRAALLARGVALAGEADHVLDVRVDVLGVAPETAAEKHEFTVDLSRADAAVPFRRWSRVTTR